MMMPHPALVAHCIFDDNDKKQISDDLLKGDMCATWISSTGNELGCLAGGIPGQVQGSNTIRFIKQNAIPKGKKITYANMVCDYKLLKAENDRVRLTIG
eukprot:14847355-Ditylum_brightwellii.AAC.1